MSLAGVNGIFNRPASCLGAWEEKYAGTPELITSDAEKVCNWKGDPREGNGKISLIDCKAMRQRSRVFSELIFWEVEHFFLKAI